MHVLVVDDNPDIVDLMKTVLESGGYEVITSQSGREGLDLILKGDFDVVLLDITMPEFGGLDIVHSLRDSGELDKNKIILFSAASVSDNDIKKWKQIGVREFLKKPFEPALMFETISNVVSS